jgi:hypothetical protein
MAGRPFVIVPAVFVPRGLSEMADETRGGMDIRMHQETWRDFSQLVKWTLIGVVVLLVLMAIFLL